MVCDEELEAAAGSASQCSVALTTVINFQFEKIKRVDCF